MPDPEPKVAQADAVQHQRLSELLDVYAEIMLGRSYGELAVSPRSSILTEGDRQLVNAEKDVVTLATLSHGCEARNGMHIHIVDRSKESDVYEPMLGALYLIGIDCADHPAYAGCEKGHVRVQPRTEFFVPKRKGIVHYFTPRYVAKRVDEGIVFNELLKTTHVSTIQ